MRSKRRSRFWPRYVGVCRVCDTLLEDGEYADESYINANGEIVCRIYCAECWELDHGELPLNVRRVGE